MFELLWIAGALFLGMHGVIHLMGFFTYWPLAVTPDLVYKTTILAGQIELGSVGMRVYSILWLIPALGFLATSFAMFRNWHRWQPVLLVMAVISFIVTALDWSVAFRGTLIDVGILITFLVASQNTKLIPARDR